MEAIGFGSESAVHIGAADDVVVVECARGRLRRSEEAMRAFAEKGRIVKKMEKNIS
jgi:hypothetical protein